MRKDFYKFISPLFFSFCFDQEDISNTRDSVSSAMQVPRISSKILRCASYFQLPSWCLDIPMKHRLSCLIYYILQLRPNIFSVPSLRLRSTCERRLQLLLHLGSMCERGLRVNPRVTNIKFLLTKSILHHEKRL